MTAPGGWPRTYSVEVRFDDEKRASGLKVGDIIRNPAASQHATVTQATPSSPTLLTRRVPLS